MGPGNSILWTTTSRTVVTVLLALLTAACQATGERPAVRLYQDYPQTEIRHLGGYDDPRYGDYGYNALRNGFDYLVSKGIDNAAIERASVQARFRLALPRFRLAHRTNQPIYYELWVKIEGCPNRVFMRTSFTGRLLTVDDAGGCLKDTASVPG